MTPQRYRKLQELFEATLQVEETRRTAYLDEMCAGDSKLREDVKGLLGQDEAVRDGGTEMNTSHRETSPAAEPLRDSLLQDVPEFCGYKVLGFCVLEARIGQGGMGAVYKARHLQLDVAVAVKCLKPSLANDEQFVLRFRREAQAAARVNDQRLVRVFEVNRSHGLHYLVMEYVDGETLNDRVGRKGPLAIDEATTIILEAAEGLSAAHRKGHRPPRCKTGQHTDLVRRRGKGRRPRTREAKRCE